MDWLYSLLSTDVPGSVTLHDWELQWRGADDFPWWVALLIAIPLAAGVVLLYWGEKSRMAFWRRWLMASIRVVLILFLLMLLMRPVLVAEFHGQRPREVAVLIDNSQSMTLTDQRVSAQEKLLVAYAEGKARPPAKPTAAQDKDIPAGTTVNPSRIHLVRQILANPDLRLLGALEGKGGPVGVYLFGQHQQKAPDRDPPVQDPLAKGRHLGGVLKGNESQSTLADSIMEFLLRNEGDLPSAIVVMTDGRDNGSKYTLDEVAAECARLKVPLFIYGVGCTDIGNLQLLDLQVKETLFYGDEVTVTVPWKAQGFDKGSAQIVLYLVGPPQIQVNEVLDWKALTTRLAKEGAAKAPAPGRRIWELLPADAQRIVQQSAGAGVIDQIGKNRLLDALNDLLKRREFHNDKDFERVTPSDEARSLLARGVKTLAGVEVQRLNRLLLEAAFPTELARTQTAIRQVGKPETVELTPEKSDKDQEVQITFVPKKGKDREEKLDVVAVIRYQGEEGVLEDNEFVQQQVRFTDNKIKVLYVEGLPRWEYKFLMSSMLPGRTQRVEMDVVLTSADPRAAQSGPPYLPAFPATPEDFRKYDLLILGDVPAKYFSEQQMEWIREFVKEGGGLTVIAGRLHCPKSYYGKPIYELLPVEFAVDVKTASDPNVRNPGFQPKLTEVGEHHDLLFLADNLEDNRKTWAGLPEVFWNFPVTKLRPSAISLVEHPKLKIGADNKPMPIVAFHYYGKGRVLFMGMEETWRWRNNVRDEYTNRFWGQVVYQLGLPHLIGNPKRVQLVMDRPSLTVGQPSYVYARLFDINYRPLTVPRATGTLERLDAKPGEWVPRTVEFEAVPGQPGEYRALLENNLAGLFSVRMTNPDVAALNFPVNLPLGSELKVAGMAATVLKPLAKNTSAGYSRTDDGFYREDTLHKLASDLRLQYTDFELRREIFLWQSWLVLVIFLTLITAEWLLRKFSGLS